MIVEFLQVFSAHKITDVYDMPAQMFFVYYRKVGTAFAIQRIHYVESHLMAKAKQWADKSTKHKVDMEYNKIKKLAEGR